MKPFTRARGKLRGLNRSSTPVQLDDSLLKTDILEGFSSANSTLVEVNNEIRPAESCNNLTITKEASMANEQEGDLNQAISEPAARALLPIISQQIEGQVSSLEDRLFTRISTLLESQRQVIPDFPNDMPPPSRRSRGGRGRSRYRNSGNRNRQSDERRSVTNAPVSAEGISGQITQDGTAETQPRTSTEIDELLQRVRISDTERNDFRRLEMHRWNISFSGDDTGLRVDEFLVRVEHIAITQRYSLEEVARNIYILLKGLAASWFFSWLTRNPDPSWVELKNQLRDHFRTADTDCDIEHAMMNRSQRSNETFDTFYHVITELNARMERRRSDKDLIEILKRNVNPKMTMFIHNSKTRILSEFLKECRRAERDIAKVEGSLNRSRPRVNELKLVEEMMPPQDEDLPQIDAIYSNLKRETPDHSKLTCFDCKKIGHKAINCQEKSNRIFCYNCGKDNYVVSNCIDCKEKNLRRSRGTGVLNS